jgi:signal transduction histidine kinase
MLAHLSGAAINRTGTIYQLADLLNDHRERARLVIALHRQIDRLEGLVDEDVRELRELLEMGGILTISRIGADLYVHVSRGQLAACRTLKVSPHNYLRDALDLLAECLEEVQK